MWFYDSIRLHPFIFSHQSYYTLCTFPPVIVIFHSYLGVRINPQLYKPQLKLLLQADYRTFVKLPI